MAASIRIMTSFLLLLVLLHAANSSSSTTAYPLHAVEITVASVKNVLEVAEGSSSANANKEISDAKAAQEVEKPWPGGRKMLVGSVLKKETTVMKDALNGEDARISGKVTPATKNSKPVSAEGSLQYSSRSENSVPQEFNGSAQNLESKKLIDEAANEVANLMNKDYPGGGGPRHKPPINNDEPLSQEHDNLLP